LPRNNHDEEEEVREPRNWTEWREDASQLLAELDRSLAQARQAIYRLRPMVRPKNEEDDGRESRQERPTQFRRQRQSRS
jgi:hypothetical protein